MKSEPTLLLLAAAALAAAADAAAQRLPAARPETETRQGEGAANPYRFATWFADYPVELQLPERSPEQVYQRSRRQALEQVVANLQGNVSRDSWLFAMDFFARAPADAAEPLIETMDRNFTSMKDLVTNVIEAMGRLGGDAFDDALGRALEHPDPAVRHAVFAALARAGSEDTIRRTFPVFLSGMDGRGRKSWLRAARLRLGDEAVAYFKQLMTPETPMPVRDDVVKEALEMAPEAAAEVLEGLWEHAQGNFKIVIAGVFHAADRASGTAHLATTLQSDSAEVVVHSLRNLVHRGPGRLLDQVLALTNDPRPAVRVEVAKLLITVPGEQATAALEVMTAPTELLEIKMIAMRELTTRGHDDAVTFLLDEVATSTGTKLTVQLKLLAASGDARCVPVFLERARRAPPAEGREFLQALAFSGAPGAAAALLELFLGEERAVAGTSAKGEQLTTKNYIPVLLPNLRGSEVRFAEAWDRIPTDDHVRRALYLEAISVMAADREDPKVQAPLVELMRRLLFDATAAPQLRIQALNALTRKFLTIDDAMRLKRLQEPIGDRESPSLRALLKDFLFEYF